MGIDRVKVKSDVVTVFEHADALISFAMYCNRSRGCFEYTAKYIYGVGAHIGAGIGISLN